MALRLIAIACEGILATSHHDGRWQPDLHGLAALARLTHAGYRVVGVMNLGRDDERARDPLRRLSDRQAQLQRLAGEAGGVIDTFFFCPHTRRQGCACRPPEPALYHEIAARWRVDLGRIRCVANTASDLAAAAAAGGRAVTVGPRPARGRGEPPGVPAYPSLAALVDALLADPAVDA